MTKVFRKSELWYDSFARIGSIAHMMLAKRTAKIPMRLTSMKEVSTGQTNNEFVEFVFGFSSYKKRELGASVVSEGLSYSGGV